MLNHQGRYQPRRKDETQALIGQIFLEWDKGTGVYARQSTINQRTKNLAAAEGQTQELLQFSYDQGAPRDARTVLYDENIDEYGWYKAASGTLRIDQREGLSALCERIERDEVKVVVCFMVDRLFRDEFLIGPGQFVKLCKEHNCKVVLRTGMVYDFSLDWYQQQFFMESLAAANWLKMQRLRLHGNRMYIARQGIYDGRFLSVGYMVDRRQFLPDGTPNPMWKRYVIYEPHAKVVLWLFRRFRELDGNLLALCREVSQINDGYIFPPFDADVSQENKKISLSERGEGGRHAKRLPPSPRGFRLSRAGIVSILTNRDYIGEWHSEGVLVRANNHDHIVPDDLFWYAYTHLAGEEKDTSHTQPRRKDTPALLDGLVTTPVGKIYVFDKVANEKRYLFYGACEHHTLKSSRYFFTIGVTELDDIFRERLIYWLERTQPPQKRREASQPDRRQEARRKQIMGQIAEVNEKLAAIEAALDTLTLPALIQKKEEDYAKLLKIKDTLELELNKPAPKDAHTILLKYQDALLLLRDKYLWQEGFGLDILRDVAKAVTTEVVLSQISSHWLQFDVTWLNPHWGSERAYIYRKNGSTPVWSTEEFERLKELYPIATKDELLRAFPNRSWTGLAWKAEKHSVYRRVGRESATIPETLSLDDWRFMQEQGLTVDMESSLSVVSYWRISSRRTNSF